MSGPGQSNQKPDTSSQVAGATMPPPKACFCQKNNTKHMKQCDKGCHVWRHFMCINIKQKEESWYCESCTKSTNSQQNATFVNVTNVTNVQMANLMLDSSSRQELDLRRRKADLIKEKEELIKKEKELIKKEKQLNEERKRIKQKIEQNKKESEDIEKLLANLNA